MRLFLSKNHSDEEGPMAEEGKLGILFVSKKDLERLKDFFDQAYRYSINNDNLHMQFRDSFPEWNPSSDIDIEINLEE